MQGFTFLDLLALGVFILNWGGYHLYYEFGPHAKNSLNALMNEARFEWMRRMLERENRMVDASIMNGLQSGTAFFASTSLLALGGTLSALGAADRALDIFAALPHPFNVATTRTAYELKVLGLAGIFTYAFFKMAWSYRIYNYVAMLIGAALPLGQQDNQAAHHSMERAARMNVIAGRHFNRGMRAFFFALAYLGWFAGPLVFLGTTASVMVVVFRRQFSSEARDAALWGR